MKKIVLHEFKRVAGSSESYSRDMWKVEEKQNTPMLTGLRALVTDREWEKEHGKKIIHRLGHTLLNEHEKLFGSYWWYTFGSPSSLLQLLGKDISVRVSQSPQGGSELGSNKRTGILSLFTTRRSLYI